MRRIFLLFIFFNGLFIFRSAKADTSFTKNCTIEIYFVIKGEFDSTKQCRYCFIPKTEDLDSLPFIKDEDIIGYEINEGAYCLLLSKEWQERQNRKGGDHNEIIRRAFALVVNGQPVYGGWFLSSYVSNFSGGIDWIHIYTPFKRFESGRLEILLDTPHLITTSSNTYNYPKWTQEFSNDPRDDERLINCLIKSGRLELKTK